MVCTKFSLLPGDGWLTNELASALQASGHHVQVVLIASNELSEGVPMTRATVEGVDVLLVAPKSIRGLGTFVHKVTKWIASPYLARWRMRSDIGAESFDLLLCFSPAFAVHWPVFWAKRQFKCRTYLVQWDFFPFHHRSIGLIPNPMVFELGRLLEQAVIRQFDIIGCMSPKNVEYLKSHYDLRPEQRAMHLPIWGRVAQTPVRPKEQVRAEHNLPAHRKIALFGGQIMEGRGIEFILAAASIAKFRRPDIVFLLLGEGRLEGLVADHIANGGENVVLMRRIPRHEYLSVAAACDVALVCTVPGVDVPTFPSKTIDYLRAGLPIVAAVEDTTDYGSFVMERGFGLSVPVGDPEPLLAAVERIIDDPDSTRCMIAKGRECLRDHFDVDVVARRLVEQVLSSSDK